MKEDNIDKFEYEYDPVKESVGGKAAERVVWSTKSILKAVDALKKGLPLKANPFIGKNTLLLKPDLVYKRTPEEVEDYIHCKEDPVYFGSKCYLKTTEGLQACKLRDYQEDYLRHLQKNYFSIILSCRQSGKSTTTAIDCLHHILFNSDKYGLILSKSGPAGQDLLKKIKDMYLYLPYHLKCGTNTWNLNSISFDNNSILKTVPFGPTSGVGDTINFLVLDEFAWMPPNDVELFWENVIPTITTIADAKVAIMSTQNGFNKFYELWKGAIEHTNAYAPFKVDWWQVPQYNKETKQWEKRDDKWKESMIKKLGSEQAFHKQFGTMFMSSDYALVSRECMSRLRDKCILFENVENVELFNNILLKYKKYLYFKPGYDFNRLKTSNYILCIDLAEGGGGDFTVFNIFEMIEPGKFEQVGYWRSNNIDLENAALEFWLLWIQLFNNDRCMFSIEWNTYGALFYKSITSLNDDEYDSETSWRWNVPGAAQVSFDGYTDYGINMDCLIQYKNETIEKSVEGNTKVKKMIPGIRFSSSNKKVACSMLKLMFENGSIITTDLVTIGELENFEDKNKNGSYQATIGHDDIIMTFCQLPMIQETVKYSSFLEDLEANNINESIESKWNDIPQQFNSSLFQPYPTFIMN